MSSSDDDFSLFASIPKPSSDPKAKRGKSGSDDDDPDWMKGHNTQLAHRSSIRLGLPNLKKQPTKGKGEADTDDDEPDWMKEHKPSSAKKGSAIELDLSSDSSGLGVRPAGTSKKAATGAKKEPKGSFSFTSSDDAPIITAGRKDRAAKSDAESAPISAKGRAKISKGSAVIASQQASTGTAAELPVASSQATVIGNAKAAAPSQGSQDAIGKGEVLLMLPEKLAGNKILVELEDRSGPDEMGSSDLSGDSGAVGRLIASKLEASAVDGGTDGDGANYQLHLDLKGALYAATLVPAPGTLCVVSVGPTEAKVEAMVSSFLQLRSESTLAMAEALMEGDLVDFMDDDDDYVFAPAAEDKAAAIGGDAKTGKGSTKASKGGAKPKVKAKPKAKAKPKPKLKAGKGNGPGVSKGAVSKRK